MKKWMMSALTALVFLAGLCLVACGGTTSWQVTFDADGGTATAAQSVEDGGTATEPADPEKEGFAFDGWFEEGAETPFDFSAPVTGNLTLTAKWTALYTLTFDSDGGTAVEAQTVRDGMTATEPADPEKEGFTFDGWFEEGAETPFDFATPITGDLTLTAGWTEEAQTSFTLADVDGIWTGSAKALGTLDVSFALTVDAENGAHAAVCYLSGSTSPLALTVESLAVTDDKLVLTYSLFGGEPASMSATYNGTSLIIEPNDFFADPVTLTRLQLTLADLAGSWAGTTTLGESEVSISMMLYEDGTGEVSCTVGETAIPLYDVAFTVADNKLVITYSLTEGGETSSMSATYDGTALNVYVDLIQTNVTLTRTQSPTEPAGD